MTELSIMQISFEELCLSVNTSEAFMLELLEYRIVEPMAGDIKNEWLFNVTAVNAANKALRLHRDLAIDLADIALLLNLLEENEQLRLENERLKKRLSRFLIGSV